MPVPRWDWGTAGPLGSRISALAPRGEDEAAPIVPTADEPVSFARHIHPLVRPMDRQSMRWAFDLWSYDATRHVTAILQRIENGSMPCDGAWAAEKVTIFRR